MSELNKIAVDEYASMVEKNLRERATLLVDAKSNKKTQEHLITMCVNDPCFYFNYFLYTDKNSAFFPSSWQSSKVPFLLFDYQKEFVSDVFDAYKTSLDPIEKRFQTEEYIDENGYAKKEMKMIPLDFFIDKSRQMGLSWTILGLLDYFYRFYNGKCHIVSRKDEEVDKSGDIKSCFEKLRFFNRSLPDWMLCKGFEKEVQTAYNKMKLIGREDGTGAITGESANPYAGTGGTYNIIFMDEMSKMGHASQINTSCSRATPIRIMNGTPTGKGTEFYRMRRLAEKGSFRWHHIHWTEHPFYTNMWYEAEKSKSTPEQIAQELDISYDTAVVGRVYPEFTGDMVKIDFDYLKPLYIGIDNSHGGSDPHAIIVATKDTRSGAIEIVDTCEFICSVTEMANILAGSPREPMNSVGKAFFERYKTYMAKGRAIFISDPHDYNTTLNQSTIAEEYRKVGIILNAPRMRGNSKQQILNTRNNMYRLRINEGNDGFVDCMFNAHYPNTVGSIYMGDNDSETSSTRTSAPDKPVHDWTSHMRTALEYLVNFIIENEVMDKTRINAIKRREDGENNPHKNVFPDEFNKPLDELLKRKQVNRPDRIDYASGDLI